MHFVQRPEVYRIVPHQLAEFFMRFLPCRIGSRQNWPGLAEPELELPEQTLALTDPQLDAVGLLNPG
jgi:hypothetical protein